MRTSGRYEKITVSLSIREIAALDSLALAIRSRTRIALSRSELLHAFIEAAQKRRMTSDEARELVERYGGATA